MHTHGDGNGGGGDRPALRIGLPVLPTAPAKEHKRGSRSGNRVDRGAADGVYPGHATREMRTGCGRNSNKIDMGMGCMINKERCKMSEEKKHDYKASISNDDHH